MEPEYEQAPIYPIPNRRFLCVEYPGIVKNIDRVLETLGGEKNVSQVYGNRENDVLELRYRPKDPFCHSINGSIVESSQVLVKVTRRRRKNEPEDQGQITTEIVGTIPHTCRFRGMADFQYLVPKTDPVRELRSALVDGDAKYIQRFKVTPDDIKPDNLHGLPPPVFSTMEEPFSYDYKQNAPVVRVRVRQPDGTYETRLVNRSKARLNQTANFVFEDKNVPMSHPPIEEPTGGALKTKEKLAELFEERPIWSRFALRCILGPEMKQHLARVLPFFAYLCQNGPWRECWVKYGVDPRTDKRFIIYQQLDIRLNLPSQDGTNQQMYSRRLNALATHASNTNNDDDGQKHKEEPSRHVFDGETVPSQSAWYQVCDITDPDFACILRSTTYHHDGPPSKRTGYFYPSALETVKNALRQKLQQLATDGYCRPMPHMDDGLAEKIEKDKEEMAKHPNRFVGKTPGSAADADADVEDDDDFVPDNGEDGDENGLYGSDVGGDAI